jgi:anti-sigma B factor antagonist
MAMKNRGLNGIGKIVKAASTLSRASVRASRTIRNRIWKEGNMTSERTAVVVKLPERLILGQIQAFLRSSNAFLEADRPRLVFDFSGVREMDSAGVEMLLHCMEQVTKQDGDLKLAAIPVEVAIVLELTCIDRLFEIFTASTEAVASFNAFSVEAAQRSLGMLQPISGSDNHGRAGNLPMAS